MSVVDRLNTLDTRLGLDTRWWFGRTRALRAALDAWPGARRSWEVRDTTQQRAVARRVASGEPPTDERDRTLWLALIDVEERGIASGIVVSALFALLGIPVVILNPISTRIGASAVVGVALGLLFCSIPALRRMRRLRGEIVRPMAERDLRGHRQPDAAAETIAASKVHATHAGEVQ